MRVSDPCGCVWIVKRRIVITVMAQYAFAMQITPPLGYERVYLPLSKVANTPVDGQGDDITLSNTSVP